VSRRRVDRSIDDDHVRHPRAEAHLAGDLADELATALQIAVALGGAERSGGRLGRTGAQVQGQASAGQAQEQEQSTRPPLVAVGPLADVQRRRLARRQLSAAAGHQESRQARWHERGEPSGTAWSPPRALRKILPLVGGRVG